MSWPEFQIRSIRLRDKRKWEQMLIREVAYEVHTLKFMFGKSKPLSKPKWWQIEGENVKDISDEQQQAFLAARKKYEDQIKKKNG